MASAIQLLKWAVQLLALAYFLAQAYEIRLFAVREYGKVIHEFDPWFNFRAAQYLVDHGWHKFINWFDTKVWYPLGRPVGHTIYPGMQVAASVIYHSLQALGTPMSINDVCVFIPAWFGVSATFLAGALTREATQSNAMGLAACAIMAVIPAHLMRSVAGGYDNESVAVTAIILTFYCWCRSIRNPTSWPVGFATGFAYVFMVASWGGYVFVVNLVALHAAVVALSFMARDKDEELKGLHKAYSLFYVIGVAGAIQIPVVGWTPLKSLEQIAALLVFLGLQVLAFCASKRGKMTFLEYNMLRFKIAAVALSALVVVAACLWPTGYFGPLSSRVRGLFVKHTRTGNPLVDSVAEHQATSPDAYWNYVHYCGYWAVPGIVIAAANAAVPPGRGAATSFLMLYLAVTYYFSSKMTRLVLILGPPTAMAGGIFVGWLFDQVGAPLEEDEPADNKVAEAKPAEPEPDAKQAGKKGKAKGKAAPSPKKKPAKNGNDIQEALKYFKTKDGRNIRAGIGAVVLLGMWSFWGSFQKHSWELAEYSLSHPSIMYKVRLRSGEQVILDDYREAYFWLDSTTRPSARIVAWWDYGYQITGIGNRTSIADGNTWNHEHIALLGKALVSPQPKAHDILRHIGDYVLVWAGGGGDDMAKSPHLARIGNSVYPDTCGEEDPTCSKFGFDQFGPTPMMQRSLLYRMCKEGQKEGGKEVTVNPKYFKLSFVSKYGKVRIYEIQNVSKESKTWVRENRDPSGRGHYPPALQALLSTKQDFAQVEDFNRKGGKKNAYTRYVEESGGR